MTAIIIKGEATLEEVEGIEVAPVESSRIAFKIGDHVIMLSETEAFTLWKYLETWLKLA